MLSEEELLERREILCKEADELEEDLRLVLDEIYKIDDMLEALDTKKNCTIMT